MLATVASLAAGEARGEASPLSRDARQTLTPVTQSVPSPPRWFEGSDGRFHVEYELLLTNALPLPVKVTSLQVRRFGGGQLETLAGAQLEAAMSLLGSPDQPTVELPPSSIGVVWLDLDLARRGAVPDRVESRVTVDLGPGLPVGPVIRSTGGGAVVARQPATVIAPPLRGPRWVAVVGPHRRSLQPVNGALRNAQRFAIDFAARMDGEDRTHVGDPRQNSSYFNYGQPVLAVAAGTVVQAVDRYHDQVPNEPAPVSLAAADGNHVIVRLSRGVYAGYAHLLPGSVRVHRGQRVRLGEVLGKLGNSGNTTGPHLHFQLMTRPSLLDADGLPFELDRFALEGRVPTLDALIEADASGAPVPVQRSVAGRHRRQGLTNLDVAAFADR